MKYKTIFLFGICYRRSMQRWYSTSGSLTESNKITMAMYTILESSP